MTRPHSQPPHIPNFRYVEHLGGGGFADVFLYQQQRPERPVAIKVLRPSAAGGLSHAAFDAEANLMAKVSEHPYIVSVFGADIAPDGRPFIVMEYYSRPHLGRRISEGPLPVDEVLRLGVRLASAVETAHRSGILHRDIKPANVLISQYGRPGLTDFGIAGLTDGRDVETSTGMTVPFAPPEVVGGRSEGDVVGDVYSLAATLYALLAGRSPFAVPGGDNSEAALVRRVLDSTVPPIGTRDVPPQLDLLLQNALARDPGQRPASAAELGRSLQRVERELGHSPTEFELADDQPLGRRRNGAGVDPGNDDDGTRAARVQIVHQPSPIAADTRPPGVAIDGVPTDLGDRSPPGVDERRYAAPRPASAADTVARRKTEPAPASVAVADPRTSAARSRSPWLAAAAGILLVAVVVGVLWRTGFSGDAAPEPTSTTPADEEALVVPVPDVPDVPTGVVVTVEGSTAVVDWDPGTPEESDTYRVLRTDSGGDQTHDVEAPPARVDGIGATGEACFRVVAQRGVRESEPSAEACAS